MSDMQKTDITNNDLFLMLKSKFPSIKLGNSDGETTVNPKEAVFFDFNFVVNGEKIASVSISLAEKGMLKLFYNRDILQDQDNTIKHSWFEFLKNLRLFAKKRLMSFEPTDITKKNLDKRDYEQMSSQLKPNFEEIKMNESSLYGSTKSSYQKLENARLIIRHSQKIHEEVANSRTRNIDSIYVENAQGERFRYPFNHLSGARAMMRHVANGGNPYDNFGQYIVGLSEQVYNLRKFNNLMHKNAFLENSELTDIAGAAQNKVNNLKKIIERIQKQSGYEMVRESFSEYKRKELDADTIEALKSRFTIQQFNEELVELFPYISDLLEGGWEPVTGGGEKGSSARNRKAVQMALGRKHKDDEPGYNDKYRGQVAALKHGRALQKKGINKEETATESALGEIGKMLGSLGSSTMREAPKKAAAKPAPAANVKKDDEPTDADAAAEPIGKIPFIGTGGDDVHDLHSAIKALPQVMVEPFDKASIVKAMDKVHAEIKDYERAVADNPKDKKMQYGLEKAQARLGLLQARMASADVQAGNPITKVGLFIDHLAKHVKDDKLSLVLSRIADGYSDMSKQERQEVNNMVSIMLKKVKYVPMFSAESTSFNELSNMLSSTPARTNTENKKYDLVSEFENLLDATIHEQSDILSTDVDVKTRALGELNHLLSDEFPVGTNGINAIESLRGIIDDRNLFKQFMEMSQEDAAGDARQMIVSWVQQNAPDVVSELNVKGIKMPKLSKDNEQANNMETPPQEDQPINEVEDFVKSLYDSNTGNFPRGETGVLSSVEKKFGERAVPVAQSVIENLKHSFDENLMRMRKLAGVS